MKRSPPPKSVTAPRLPPLRLFLLAGAAVACAVWAVAHHYTRPHPPMLVPAEAAAEIPAPSVIEVR